MSDDRVPISKAGLQVAGPLKEELHEWLAAQIVVEDAVGWRGDYWERTVHLSEARYKKAFGEWVPEGYESTREEVHRTV